MKIDSEQLLAVAAKAATEPIEPEPELIIPAALMEREDVAKLCFPRRSCQDFAPEVAGEEEAKRPRRWVFARSDWRTARASWSRACRMKRSAALAVDDGSGRRRRMRLPSNPL